MGDSWKPFIVSFCVLSFVFVGCNKSGSRGTIRVALTRDDNVYYNIGTSFVFDEKEVAAGLEKRPTKFPDQLPAGARKVMFEAGRVFGIVQKAPEKTHVLLTLDVNANSDLTDDAPVEVPFVEDRKQGIVVKVARHFTVPEAHTEWLPYRLSYQETSGPSGEVREYLSVRSNYDYKGEFRLGDKDYNVILQDGDHGGRFVREKHGNVQFRLGPKEEMARPGVAPWHALSELIPIGGALYEVKAIAEDGSWIEFAGSGLTATTLGKKAPDMSMTDTEGKIFRISDYRGKVLVLDFWYSWCKPCIAKFPAIKEMIESFSDKPLAAVGVNIDVPERVELAKKVIADNGLAWRQVVEGKGDFLPVYQVYGRLPEHPMSFPIYVAIDERGVARYATNDFEKMGRFLEAHFREPEGPDHTMFIPLSQVYGAEKKSAPLTAVDFSGPKAKALAESGAVKLPPGLPPSARVGRMPNGIPLVAYPGPKPDKVILILDADGNGDVSNDEVYEIPVLDDPEPDESKIVEADCRIYYKSGNIYYGGFPFFGRPSKDPNAQPDVYFKGKPSDYAGTFYAGRDEYRLELSDPNGDRMMTDEDLAAPGLLKLKVKRGETWAEVHSGTRGIPIGRSLYRLRAISDDGFLVELEREK